MIPDLEQRLRASASDRERANLLNDEAWKLREQNIGLAMEVAIRARSYAESAGYKAGIASSYYMTGIFHKQLGHTEKALEDSEIALAIQREQGDKAALARTLNAVGTFYHQQRNFPQALRCMQEGIALYDELEDKRYLTVLLGNLGFLYRDFAQFDKALEVLFRAVQHDQQYEDSDKSLLIMIYCTIASCYQEFNDDESTLKYYQIATELTEKYGNIRQASSLYMMKGEYHRRKQQLREALEYWYKALDLTEKLGLVEATGLTLRYIGQGLLESGDYPAAEKVFQEVLKTHSIGTVMAGALMGLGKIRCQLQQYDEARSYYEQALAVCREINDIQLCHTSHTELANIGEATHDYVLAFEHQRSAAHVYNEIFRMEKQKAAAEMQAKFDVEAAEREKELFRVKNIELSAALDEVRRLNDNLTKVNNEKNEVLGIVAHDLKSPLSGVRMVASLVKEHYRRMPEVELEHQLDAIIDSTERMLSISASLLNAQKIEKGDMYGAPQQVDVSAVVYQLADSYRQMAEQKNIGFETACEDSVNTVCSEEALRQAVENIVSNAVKFTPQGKKVTVRVRSQQKKVIVEVEDEGPGIRAQERKKLYGKYSRLSARPTGGESTTGLGLWIAKKAVEAMHGRIRCTSKVGSGTVFSIEVPLL